MLILNVCSSLLPRIARDARTSDARERSDKECLEGGEGGGGEGGGEGGGGGGEEPDPFVETALHCMPQSEKEENGASRMLEGSDLF